MENWKINNSYTFDSSWSKFSVPADRLWRSGGVDQEVVISRCVGQEAAGEILALTINFAGVSEASYEECRRLMVKEDENCLRLYKCLAQVGNEVLLMV